MNDFERQLDQNLQNDIKTFNTDPKYLAVRNMYKSNFATIQQYIAKYGNRGAIEDIAKLDQSLTDIVNEEMLLLKEINRAIHACMLTVAMIS